MTRAALQRIYRRGCQALGATHADHSDENLHELRKHAKFLAHAVETLAHGRNPVRGERFRLARSIASRLGDDRDLARLHALIAAAPVADRTVCAPMLEHLAHCRAQLQRKALKQAHRLYRSKAG
ncbi:unnamed protein product, partial [Phaeothamnion confervicola]